MSYHVLAAMSPHKAYRIHIQAIRVTLASFFEDFTCLTSIYGENILHIKEKAK